MQSNQITDAASTQESSAGIKMLALMLKERENPSPSEPVFGVILSLDPLKIQLDNKKVIIEAAHITSLINLFETDEYGRYIHKGKRVAMIMYNTGYINSMPDFLVLGVIK